MIGNNTRAAQNAMESLAKIGIVTRKSGSKYASFYMQRPYHASIIMHTRRNPTKRYYVAKHEVMSHKHLLDRNPQENSIVLYENWVAFDVRKILSSNPTEYQARPSDPVGLVLDPSWGFPITDLIAGQCTVGCAECEKTIFLDPQGVWRHLGNGRDYCTITVPVVPKFT